MIRRMLVLSAMVCRQRWPPPAMHGDLCVAHSTCRAQPGIIVDPSCSPVGGSITVEGSGVPGQLTVTIQINGAIAVGTATSNPDGDFLTDKITLPPSITPGQYTRARAVRLRSTSPPC